MTLPSLTDEQLGNLDEWLRSVLWSSVLPGIHKAVQWEIYRVKGRMLLVNGGIKMLQGVREIFELIDSTVTSPQTYTGSHGGKIVMIGRNIGNDPNLALNFQKSLFGHVVRRTRHHMGAI